MAKYENIYPIEESIDEVSAKYLFVSSGKKDVIKAVEYQYVQPHNGDHLYNLAFGDFDLETASLDDQINTNNGDHYAVFNTVLSTIPSFFENNPRATMMVQGNDNSEEFINNCRQHCARKCKDACKNAGRRIKTYRYFVNKNYDDLIGDYEFQGGLKMSDGTIILELYQKEKEYDSVFCKKRISLHHED